MLKTQFCIVYTYKGSSTDWYPETYKMFMETSDQLVAFILKTRSKPDQYAIYDVYRCNFENISDVIINDYEEKYREHQEKIIDMEIAKKKIAESKLYDSGLTSEDIKVLKDAKII